MERKQRKVYQGRVVSDKMDKTITVVVETKRNHPVYGNALTILKNIKLTTKTTLQKLATSFVSWKLVLCLKTNISVL